VVLLSSTVAATEGISVNIDTTSVFSGETDLHVSLDVTVTGNGPDNDTGIDAVVIDAPAGIVLWGTHTGPEGWNVTASDASSVTLTTDNTTYAIPLDSSGSFTLSYNVSLFPNETSILWNLNATHLSGNTSEDDVTLGIEVLEMVSAAPVLYGPRVFEGQTVALRVGVINHGSHAQQLNDSLTFATGTFPATGPSLNETLIQPMGTYTSDIQYIEFPGTSAVNDTWINVTIASDNATDSLSLAYATNIEPPEAPNASNVSGSVDSLLFRPNTTERHEVSLSLITTEGLFDTITVTIPTGFHVSNVTEDHGVISPVDVGWLVSVNETARTVTFVSDGLLGPGTVDMSILTNGTDHQDQDLEGIWLMDVSETTLGTTPIPLSGRSWIRILETGNISVLPIGASDRFLSRGQDFTANVTIRNLGNTSIDLDTVPFIVTHAGDGLDPSTYPVVTTSGTLSPNGTGVLIISGLVAADITEGVVTWNLTIQVGGSLGGGGNITWAQDTLTLVNGSVVSPTAVLVDPFLIASPRVSLFRFIEVSATVSDVSTANSTGHVVLRLDSSNGTFIVIGNASKRIPVDGTAVWEVYAISAGFDDLVVTVETAPDDENSHVIGSGTGESAVSIEALDRYPTSLISGSEYRHPRLLSFDERFVLFYSRGTGLETLYYRTYDAKGFSQSGQLSTTLTVTPGDYDVVYGNGTYHIVYQASGDIYYAAIDAETGILDIGATQLASGGASGARLDLDEMGDIYITYADAVGDTEVFYRKFNHSWSPVSQGDPGNLSDTNFTLIGPVQVTSNGANTHSPDISVDAGYIHLVWQDDQSSQYRIYYAKYNTTGTLIIDETQLSTGSVGNSSAPRVIADGMTEMGENTTGVFWLDDESTYQKLLLIQLNASFIPGVLGNPSSLVDTDFIVAAQTQLTTPVEDATIETDGYSLNMLGQGRVEIVTSDTRDHGSGQHQVYYSLVNISSLGVDEDLDPLMVIENVLFMATDADVMYPVITRNGRGDMFVVVQNGTGNLDLITSSTLGYGVTQTVFDTAKRSLVPGHFTEYQVDLGATGLVTDTVELTVTWNRLDPGNDHPWTVEWVGLDILNRTSLEPGVTKTVTLRISPTTVVDEVDLLGVNEYRIYVRTTSLNNNSQTTSDNFLVDVLPSPDLTVSMISFSEDTPQRGKPSEDVDITARIENVGIVNATAFNVQFVAYNIISGTWTNISQPITINSLVPSEGYQGNYFDHTVTWSTVNEDIGRNLIYVNVSNVLNNAISWPPEYSGEKDRIASNDFGTEELRVFTQTALIIEGNETFTHEDFPDFQQSASIVVKGNGTYILRNSQFNITDVNKIVWVKDNGTMLFENVNFGIAAAGSRATGSFIPDSGGSFIFEDNGTIHFQDVTIRQYVRLPGDGFVPGEETFLPTMLVRDNARLTMDGAVVVIDTFETSSSQPLGLVDVDMSTNLFELDQDEVVMVGTDIASERVEVQSVDIDIIGSSFTAITRIGTWYVGDFDTPWGNRSIYVGRYIDRWGDMYLAVDDDPYLGEEVETGLYEIWPTPSRPYVNLTTWTLWWTPLDGHPTHTDRNHDYRMIHLNTSSTKPNHYYVDLYDVVTRSTWTDLGGGVWLRNTFKAWAQWRDATPMWNFSTSVSIAATNITFDHTTVDALDLTLSASSTLTADDTTLQTLGGHMTIDAGTFRGTGTVINLDGYRLIDTIGSGPIDQGLLDIRADYLDIGDGSINASGTLLDSSDTRNYDHLYLVISGATSPSQPNTVFRNMTINRPLNDFDDDDIAALINTVLTYDGFQQSILQTHVSDAAEVFVYWWFEAHVEDSVGNLLRNGQIVADIANPKIPLDETPFYLGSIPPATTTTGGDGLLLVVDRRVTAGGFDQIGNYEIHAAFGAEETTAISISFTSNQQRSFTFPEDMDLVMNNDEPTIVVTKPITGVYSGRIIVTGLAGDQDDFDSIQWVRVSVDGGPWLNADDSSLGKPYESWSMWLETAPLGVGSHTIQAKVLSGGPYDPLHYRESFSGITTFSVINRPPSMVVLAPTNDTLWAEEQNLTLPIHLEMDDLDANDDTFNAFYRVLAGNGSEIVGWTGLDLLADESFSGDLPSLSLGAGTFTLQLRVVSGGTYDTAYYLETIQDLSMTIDHSPEASISGLVPGEDIRGVHDFSGSILDPDGQAPSGVEVRITRDGDAPGAFMDADWSGSVVDGQWVGTWNSSIQTVGLPNGTYDLEVRAYAPGGVPVIMRTETFNVTNHVPVVMVVDPGLTSSRTPSHTITGTAFDPDDIDTIDGVASVVYTLRYDGNGTDVYGSPVTMDSYDPLGYGFTSVIDTSVLPNGVYRAEVMARSNRSEDSPIITSRFVVDHAVPSLTMTWPLEGSLVNGIVSFLGSGSDADSSDILGTVEYRVFPDSVWLPGIIAPAVDDTFDLGFSIDTRSLPDGPARVDVRVNDGLLDSAIVPYFFNVSNSPPSIIIDRLPSGNNLSFDTTFGYVFTGRVLDPDVGDGVTQITLTIKNEALQTPFNLTLPPVTSSTFRPLGGGEYQFTYPVTYTVTNFLQSVYYDFIFTVLSANNETTEHTLHYVVNKKPKVRVSGLSQGEVIAGTKEFTVTGEDETVDTLFGNLTVFARIDRLSPFGGYLPGSSFEVIGGTVSINSSQLANGNYRLNATAWDTKAYSNSVDVAFTVENHEPVISWYQPTSGNTVSGTFRVVGGVVENDPGDQIAGIYTSIYSVGGSPGAWRKSQSFVDFDLTYDSTTMANGEYELQVRAVSLFGDVATEVRRIIVLNRAPTTVLTSHVSSQEVSGVITLRGTTEDPDDDDDVEQVIITISPNFGTINISDLAQGSPQLWEFELDTRQFQNGPIRISYNGISSNGDVEVITVVVLNVLNLPPEVTILSETWDDTGVTLRGTAIDRNPQDEVSSVWTRVGSGEIVMAESTGIPEGSWDTWNQRIDLSSLTDGDYTITVGATSSDGQNGTLVHDITVNFVNPELVVETPAPGEVLYDSFELRGTKAGDEPISWAQVLLDGEWIALSSADNFQSWEYTTSILRPGDYPVTIRYNDGIDTITLPTFTVTFKKTTSVELVELFNMPTTLEPGEEFRIIGMLNFDSGILPREAGKTISGDVTFIFNGKERTESQPASIQPNASFGVQFESPRSTGSIIMSIELEFTLEDAASKFSETHDRIVTIAHPYVYQPPDTSSTGFQAKLEENATLLVLGEGALVLLLLVLVVVMSRRGPREPLATGDEMDEAEIVVAPGQVPDGGPIDEGRSGDDYYSGYGDDSYKPYTEGESYGSTDYPRMGVTSDEDTPVDDTGNVQYGEQYSYTESGGSGSDANDGLEISVDDGPVVASGSFSSSSGTDPYSPPTVDGPPPLEKPKFKKVKAPAVGDPPVNDTTTTPGSHESADTYGDGAIDADSTTVDGAGSALPKKKVLKKPSGGPGVVSQEDVAISSGGDPMSLIGGVAGASSGSSADTGGSSGPEMDWITASPLPPADVFVQVAGTLWSRDMISADEKDDMAAVISGLGLDEAGMEAAARRTSTQTGSGEPGWFTSVRKIIAADTLGKPERKQVYSRYLIDALKGQTVDRETGLLLLSMARYLGMTITDHEEAVEGYNMTSMKDPPSWEADLKLLIEGFNEPPKAPEPVSPPAETTAPAQTSDPVSASTTEPAPMDVDTEFDSLFPTGGAPADASTPATSRDPLDPVEGAAGGRMDGPPGPTMEPLTGQDPRVPPVDPRADPRGGYDPRYADPRDPRADPRGGYDPRYADPRDPRADPRGGYDPRYSDPRDPRADPRAGYDPRYDRERGYPPQDPRADPRAGYDPRFDDPRGPPRMAPLDGDGRERDKRRNDRDYYKE